MSNVSAWSVSAGLNNASPPDGWPEGMARSAVNDTAREMMAALARWYKDSSGTLTTAGGTTAYTLTTNSAYASLAAIPLLAIKANVANTGAATLNIDGLGALSLTKAGGVALAAGDFTTGKVYAVVYTGARFEILNTVSGDTIPSGTLMLFQQTAAPTGWTKQVTHDNKALRAVTGAASSGGSTAFTSVFTSRTIAQANLPNVNFSNSLTVNAHTHPVIGTSAAMNSNQSHTHSYSAPNSTHTTIASGALGTAENIASLTTGSTNIDHTHSMNFTSGSASPGVSGTVSSGGSGTGLDFAVQYVDVIIAARA